jgi:hypothetical protein
MSEQPPDPAPGVRFSLLYGQRGEPTEESERMRHRIGAAIESNDWLNNQNFKHRLEQDIGVDAPWTESWPPFVKRRLALNDVLDLLSISVRGREATLPAQAQQKSRYSLRSIKSGNYVRWNDILEDLAPHQCRCLTYERTKSDVRVTSG